jgi:hypothetical protein
MGDFVGSLSVPAGGGDCVFRGGVLVLLAGDCVFRGGVFVLLAGDCVFRGGVFVSRGGEFFLGGVVVPPFFFGFLSW